MSRLTMMITSENAIQKAMTRPRLSVHHTSFLWTLCQELVRSTIHRLVAATGAGLPFREVSAFRPPARSFSRVGPPSRSHDPGGYSFPLAANPALELRPVSLPTAASRGGWLERSLSRAGYP